MRFGIPFFHKFTSSLSSTDRLLIAFWGFLACISLSLFLRIPHWRLLLFAELTAVVLTCLIAHAAQSTGLKWVRWVHDWSAFPLVLFSYKLIYYIIGPFHSGRDFDRLLIAADRWLFGTDPTAWLTRISHPYLTELLQVAYTLFYLHFIIAGIELYRKSESRPAQYFRFTVVYGFIVSYIGYFFLPAVGPRFTLHEFSKINIDLPGLFFTPAMRRFVDFFESIPPDVPDTIARAAAQRDVFPSGHTMLMLIVIFLAYRYRLKIRHPLLVAGMLLIFATVYLRYHYVIDIIAGVLLAFLCLATSERLYARFGNISGSQSE
jgi:membrane-associated phospholipid phosphatase